MSYRPWSGILNDSTGKWIKCTAHFNFWPPTPRTAHLRSSFESRFHLANITSSSTHDGPVSAGRVQLGHFAALLTRLTPSSIGSRIALSRKSQSCSLSLCLPTRNRWRMCKRYSSTTSRHPRSPISYPTSRACNLKYGHASITSRAHSDMSKISIT